MLLLLFPLALRAEDPPIEANPNRPTLANLAFTTQPGVSELEWGWQRNALRGYVTSFGTPTLLKHGLQKDLELRLSSTSYLRLTPPGDATASGRGDLTRDLQWCNLHDALLSEGQAIRATHTFPAATSAKGFGGGAPRLTSITGLRVGLGRVRHL
jgi:hypothetical protein